MRTLLLLVATAAVISFGCGEVIEQLWRPVVTVFAQGGY